MTESTATVASAVSKGEPPRAIPCAGAQLELPLAGAQLELPLPPK